MSDSTHASFADDHGGHSPRSIDRVFGGYHVMEGAGVRLRRIIGSRELNHIDPFLLLDEFKSDNPEDYIAGFPWHPHRGIETVTYMVTGQMRHEDSIGNAGVIGPGDVQWMTAGHGIIHSEMPEQKDGKLWGFQLWVNLPSRQKMCDPRYQEVSADKIPIVELPGGATVRVVAGKYQGINGPITEIEVDPLYLDIQLPANTAIRLPIFLHHNAFCYVYEGSGDFGAGDDMPGRTIAGPNILLLGDGDHLRIHTSDAPVRFLLVAGKPLNESVARGGPFVMNTREEIEQAFRDFHNGTLLKKR